MNLPLQKHFWKLLFSSNFQMHRICQSFLPPTSLHFKNQSLLLIQYDWLCNNKDAGKQTLNSSFINDTASAQYTFNLYLIQTEHNIGGVLLLNKNILGTPGTVILLAI